MGKKMIGIKERSTASIISSLGKLSGKWLNKDFYYRKKAVTRLTQCSGFTEKMSQEMLDSIFSELTQVKLTKLLRTEIREPGFLDDFKKDPVSGNFCRAMGPGIILHVFSGNVPNPAILSFIFGMLTKSVNVGKCSSKDEGFLDIYLESLRGSDPSLASANRLLDPTDRSGLQKALALSDLVVVYGDDSTIQTLRAKTPLKTSFFGYGHKASFSFYTKECFSRVNAEKLAKKTARDIWMLDQRGCLSPLEIFLEAGGVVTPAQFSGLVAKHLERLSSAEKFTGTFIKARLADYQKFRNHLKLEQLKNKKIVLWESSVKGFWAVVYQKDPEKLSLSKGRQVIFMNSVRSKKEFYELLRPMRGHLQAVALEAGEPQRKRMARELSALGVNRVCRAGTMQLPPVFWHHDGMPNLASWLKWADLEN